MPIILDSLQKCHPGSFEKKLKSALESLPTGMLPLEKGTTRGGFVDDSHISVTVIKLEHNENFIQAKAGVFFTEIIVGCGCGDDPMPENAYCEMLISIDIATAEAEFELIEQ